MDVTGVRETFGDELTLLGALQLRWHTRLAGHLERGLLDQPDDLAGAAVGAWHTTADGLPGTRLILDPYRTEPVADQMATPCAAAAAQERILLPANARRPGTRTEETVAAGLQLEELARTSYRRTQRASTSLGSRGAALLQRISFHVA